MNSLAITANEDKTAPANDYDWILTYLTTC
jgi:hypothetical protein